MLDRRNVALLGASAVVFVVSVAFAADVAVRGRRMFVREGQSGEPSRRVVIVGREGTGAGPLSPGEFAYGANLRVLLDGSSAQSQLYFLAPEGWTSTARGQRYTGTGANPVHEVLIDADGGQPTRIRVVLRGDVGSGPLNLVPPDPGTGGAMSLAGLGDTYCVAFGGAAGGTIKANTASLFRMKGATAEVACPAVPTPLPTTVVTPGPCGTPCGATHTPGPTATFNMCVQLCAPTPTPTPTPVPCDTNCPTPVVTPQASPPPPTATPTPCPTICS